MRPEILRGTECKVAIQINEVMKLSALESDSIADPIGPNLAMAKSDSKPVPAIRARTPDDIPAIRDLLCRVYPSPIHGPGAVWSERNLLSHLSRFPEGQFVAVLPDGRLVGTATSMRVSLDLALTPHLWSEITGRGSLSTHDPEGDALYGVNIAVDPAFQGQGIGRAMYEARISLARRLGCRAFVAGARIPGFHQYESSMSPEHYLQEVKAGRIFDPTVSKQMRVGFHVCGLLRDYAPDPETLGHAALIILEL